jgi:2-methylisocitrate lyase-like PEP mutase family enzyme
LRRRDAPEFAAETIRMAAEAGACGGSIEDATGRTDEPIYALELAVERVRAAVEAAKSLDFPFTLTARCENFLHGRNDLADTIARLQAYQEAGADVLYAPGITAMEEIETVVRSVDRPVNVLMGLKGMVLTVAQATDLGVRRLSMGSGLARAAYGTLLRAAREISEHGTFNFGDDVSGLSELCRLFPI